MGSGHKQYREWQTGQSFLLPPSPRDWLEEGHLAYFILDVVEELDLRAIEDEIQSRDARGTRPYSPRMMLALLVYGYCRGIYSSRRIARATYEDVAFRVLSAGEHPHFTRINEFRRRHLPAMKWLFLQVLRLCEQAGLVKLGHVALDGTKVQANASKHKAMSYKRMKEEEQRLQAEIDALFERAEQTDAEEDALYGEGEKPEDLPGELRRREQRLVRIREAREALEKEAREARAQDLREQAERAHKRSEESEDEVDRKRAKTLAEKRESRAEELSGDEEVSFETEQGLAKHRVPTTTEGEPTEAAQRNFTDAESRIMKHAGGYLQGYNCQAAVDGESQVVVAAAITNQCPDNANLEPMLEQVENNCGRRPEAASADSGYWEPDAVERVGRESNVYVATGRRAHGGEDAEGVKQCDDAQGRLAQMNEKLRSPQGRAIYARRKAIVEPVFGQIKEARRFRRFLLRGLEAANGEWTLVCLCHNLLKLFGHAASGVAAAA